MKFRQLEKIKILEICVGTAENSEGMGKIRGCSVKMEKFPFVRVIREFFLPAAEAKLWHHFSKKFSTVPSHSEKSEGDEERFQNGSGGKKSNATSYR